MNPLQHHKAILQTQLNIQLIKTNHDYVQQIKGIGTGQ